MKLSESVQGDPPPDELGRRALNQLSEYLGAVAGSFFVAEPGGFRRLANSGLSAPRPSDWFADTAKVLVRTRRTEARRCCTSKTSPRITTRFAPARANACQPSSLPCPPASTTSTVGSAVLEFCLLHADRRARAVSLLRPRLRRPSPSSRYARCNKSNASPICSKRHSAKAKSCRLNKKSCASPTRSFSNRETCCAARTRSSKRAEKSSSRRTRACHCSVTPWKRRKWRYPRR